MRRIVNYCFSSKRFTVSIIGRPNVGKSSLFNLLHSGRDSAVVSPEKGVTRDRKEVVFPIAIICGRVWVTSSKYQFVWWTQQESRSWSLVDQLSTPRCCIKPSQLSIIPIWRYLLWMVVKASLILTSSSRAGYGTLNRARGCPAQPRCSRASLQISRRYPLDQWLQSRMYSWWQTNARMYIR